MHVLLQNTDEPSCGRHRVGDHQAALKKFRPKIGRAYYASSQERTTHLPRLARRSPNTDLGMILHGFKQWY